jgi:hypothetical protein
VRDGSLKGPGDVLCQQQCVGLQLLVTIGAIPLPIYLLSIGSVDGDESPRPRDWSVIAGHGSQINIRAMFQAHTRDLEPVRSRGSTLPRPFQRMRATRTGSLPC